MQTETEKNEPEERFGKFDTAEALLDAYNALEAEFTKRCQLISKLQTELSELRAAQATEEPPEKSTPSDQIAEQVNSVRSSADVNLDGVILAIEKDPDFAIVLATLPEVCDACITNYKQRLLSFPARSPHGAPVIAPIKKPRTLLDAKRLVDEMLG